MHLTGACGQYLLLQEGGVHRLNVWDLRRGQGRRLLVAGRAKGAADQLPYTACVPISACAVLVEAWSNEWTDKRLGMWLRADTGSRAG